MKKEEVKVGMKVKVNDLPDDETQIYTVKSVEGFSVEITYNLKDGREVSPMWVDVRLLRRARQWQD